MHDHVFDEVSGWCQFCTFRNDGRLAHHGDIWREGQHYTAAEIHEMLERNREANHG